MKFTLTKEQKLIMSKGREVKLHRIRAATTFQTRDRTIFAGELGGFVEKEDNLSQDMSSRCWISDNACVYDYAYIRQDASIAGDVVIHDHATVTGAAQIGGHAEIYNYANVKDSAIIRGNAKVGGYAYVGDRALIDGDAYVWGGKGALATKLVGMTTLIGCASIQSNNDYIVIGPFGHLEYYLTFYVGVKPGLRPNGDRNIYYAKDTPSRLHYNFAEYPFQDAFSTLDQTGSLEGLIDVHSNTLRRVLQWAEEKLNWIATT